MPTLITVTRKLTVLALLDIENPDFACQYGFGVWWAMYGDEQGKGPYDDRYLTKNISRNLLAGRYDSLASSSFSAVGFYLGMLHGGWLVKPSDTLVALTDSDFTKGYYAGRDYCFTDALLDGRHLSDWLFNETINAWALDYHTWQEPQETLRYSLGCRIGELSGAALPLSMDELTFEGSVTTGQVVRL